MAYFLGQYVHNYEEIIRDDETKLSKTYFAYNIIQNKECYLKSISKEKIKKEDFDFLVQKINSEIQINTICKSKNVIELNKRFETDDYYNFEFEYSYDNLYKKIIFNYGGLNNTRNPPPILRKTILDISNALKTLNDLGIMHRDIKPHNIFINDFEEDKKEIVVKLGNFGCATFIEDNKSEPIGTIPYIAPEILKNEEYNEKCDLWSLGVTLYELYFGIHPFEHKDLINLDSLIENINSEKFLLLKSKIPSFDILLHRLLQKDPKKRMSFNELFDFVFDKNFLINENAFLESKPYYKNLYNSILLEEEPLIDDHHYHCCPCSYEQSKIIREKIVSLIKSGNIFDFDNMVDDYLNNKKMIYNNIIYFTDNDKTKNESIKYIDYFENMTPGAFILCHDFKSLELVLNDISIKNKRNKNTIFNAIINSNSCDKIIDFLNSNSDFKKCINKVCIFCPDLDNLQKIKNKRNSNDVYDVYTKQSEIKEFIKKFSSKDIKPFSFTKLITYNDYISKYKIIHLKISEFYGDISLEDYKNHIGNKIKLTNDQTEKSKLEKYEKLIGSDFREFLDYINKSIRKVFFKENFYDDISNWMKITQILPYESIPYITSRLMYGLNIFGNKDKRYFDKDKAILRKGIKLSFSSLMPYIKAKGKIILFSSFILTSLEENLAKILSNRENSKVQYKISKLFSVIYIIKYNYQKNWIPNAIIVDEKSPKEELKEIKEILLLPFSFYHLTDIEIDFNNYTADIYLETIGKTEIFEEKIKLGKNIIYNGKKNIMEIQSWGCIFDII